MSPPCRKKSKKKPYKAKFHSEIQLVCLGCVTARGERRFPKFFKGKLFQTFLILEHYPFTTLGEFSFLIKRISISPCFFLYEISRTILLMCFLQPYFPNDSVVFALGNLCQDLLLVNYSKISDRQPFTYLVVYNLVWH